MKIIYGIEYLADEEASWDLDSAEWFVDRAQAQAKADEVVRFGYAIETRVIESELIEAPAPAPEINLFCPVCDDLDGDHDEISDGLYSCDECDRGYCEVTTWREGPMV